MGASEQEPSSAPSCTAEALCLHCRFRYARIREQSRPNFQGNSAWEPAARSQAIKTPQTVPNRQLDQSEGNA
eukprot:2117066-Pleurochrysis_carterae.AAC.2